MKHLRIPAAADLHAHLRDDKLMRRVAPTIRQGGVETALVMPNLEPPITTVPMALAYKQRLQAAAPGVEFLMTLYLCPEITEGVVREAAAAGIVGIKSYPKGLTTNSDRGVVDLEAYDKVFRAMEAYNLVLNLHGEAPSDEHTTVLTAEAAFLPSLLRLHERYPRLRIVLEHCTTKAAIDAVLGCGDTVAATITAHHLYLTVDSWAGNPFAYCKPVAKLPSDRQALIDAAVSGNPKFFLGTDSAPHIRRAKCGDLSAAGVFTQPYALPYVAQVFESASKLERLEDFVSKFGRDYYQLAPARGEIILEKRQSVVEVLGEGDEAIVPFLAGHSLPWSCSWV